MSDSTNSLLTAAGVAGALYLGHRWLTRKEPETPAPAVDPEPETATDKAAPVSPPSQVDTPITRDFDAVFVTHGARIPAAYLRALAARESDMNPNRTSGPSWGLLGIDDVTRNAYNKRRGTNFRRVDLLTPAINVAIGADQLRLIVAHWRRFLPDVTNLQENWQNLRFVELLTLGWATSFGNQAGIGRVVDYLRKRGITDVTADKVYAHAAAAGASPRLAREENLAFAKSVARLYDRERVNSSRSG